VVPKFLRALSGVLLKRGNLGCFGPSPYFGHTLVFLVAHNS